MTKQTLSDLEALKAVLSEVPDHLALAEMLGFKGRNMLIAVPFCRLWIRIADQTTFGAAKSLLPFEANTVHHGYGRIFSHHETQQQRLKSAVKRHNPLSVPLGTL